MKKGRHRRFEEARALKRGPEVDIEGILEGPEDDEFDASLPGRSAWFDDEVDPADETVSD